MSRGKAKGTKKEKDMTKELFAALEQICEETNVPIDVLCEKLKDAMLKAAAKAYDCDEYIVNIDPEKNIFEVCVLRTVVEDEPIDINEINIEEAKVISSPNVQPGDRIPYKLSMDFFGRVAAKLAKNTIHADIKDFEREKLKNQFKDKEDDIVSAIVQKVEPKSGNVTILIDNNEIYLHKFDQIPGESFSEGQVIKVYVCPPAADGKASGVKISRKRHELVKRLFELEIPEIYDGTVEIKKIARVAGSRTKVAVCTKDPNVDPIGACIGPKHSRIEKIVNELNGEKIDIIVYDEDVSVFIAHALAPADVLKVTIDENSVKAAEEQAAEGIAAGSKEKLIKPKCTVIVPNDQLSLAIGNKGQNAKLAADLTGYNIDIKPENPVAESEE